MASLSASIFFSKMIPNRDSVPASVFGCNKTHKPETLLQVQWIFEEKIVPYSERVSQQRKGSENALHFSNVRERDFGLYMCMANNSIGLGVGYVELSGNFYSPNSPEM